ncbi:MAG: GntR family transcriptional regulator [Burkholderiaceae bacterium]|nr:GntR family transcriptional regulator [Burkholderiaceae bacterium]
MSLSPVPSHSRTLLSEDAYHQIKEAIHNFSLIPGDRFTESQLVELLQISRTPIRQALFRLQQEGLVEVLFRNGWRVPPIDFRHFDALYDFRILIEIDAVQRLCEDRSTLCPSEKARLFDALSSIWLSPNQRFEDGPRVSQLDESFHCTIVRAAGNPAITRAHQEITEKIRVIRRLDFSRNPRVEATYNEHAKILRAILDRRSDQARMLLKAHIEASQMEVRKITLHQLESSRRDAGSLIRQDALAI